MYVIGFIKNDEPRSLINPVMCRTEKDLYTWLINFFNDENFKLDEPITEENLNQSLLEGLPVLVQIAGFKVAFMLGEDGVIQENTDRYVHTDLFKYSDYMAS